MLIERRLFKLIRMLIRFKLGIDRWQGVVFSRILRELIHFVQLFVKLISKGEKEATWKW